MLLSATAFADFSAAIIGKESSELQDKEFSSKNLEKIHKGHNEIILTFDDGPTPGVTDKVLDVLKEKNIKATFFVIADKAATSPSLMKRIFDEGHIVANHSMTHKKALNDLSFLSRKKALKREVLEAHNVIAPYMGNGKNFFFRAPEGKWEDKNADFLNGTDIGRRYIGPLLWDIGGAIVTSNGVVTKAADWDCWNKNKLTVEQCAAGYISESKLTKGGVVLMHDLNVKSAKMLEIYLPALEEAGFTFKTLDDVNWK